MQNTDSTAGNVLLQNVGFGVEEKVMLEGVEE